MDNGLFGAVLLLLAVGLPLVVLMHRLRAGALAGYLLTGAVLGTIGRYWEPFSAVNPANLAPLAEIGAVLLLFTLGLEFDLRALRPQLRQLAIGAPVQIGLTVMVGTLAGMAVGLSPGAAVAIGCCLAMSSTLFILRGLDERGMRHRPEGRLAVSMSLAQDISVAPMLLLLSLVLPASAPKPWWWIVAGMVVFALGTLWFRRVLAGLFIDRLKGLQVPEVEVAFAVVVALGASWLADHAGLGAAFGAFCAGLALGGTGHRESVHASVRPLQGLMAILFFAAMGVLFDPAFVAANPLQVVVALAVSVVAKVVLAAVALRLAGMRARTALGAGLLVGSFGEFSFIIAGAAFGGTTDPHLQHLYNLAIAVTCLGLALTPFLTVLAVRFLPRSPLEAVSALGDTVVVAGLGPIGNTVVAALRSRGHPLLLVDRNRRLLDPWEGITGITCHLGRIEDMDDWLPTLGHRPVLVVLTFPIADTSALVARRLHELDPLLVIVARSPFLAQCDLLRAAGVRHVICDEAAVADALTPVLDQALCDAGGDPRRQVSTRLTLKRITARVDNPDSGP